MYIIEVYKVCCLLFSRFASMYENQLDNVKIYYRLALTLFYIYE